MGALVLAAGASTRLGRPKQLLDYGGEPLVRRAARAALEAGARPVVVVLGAGAREVGEAVAGLAGVRLIVHAGWADGLASSLAAGVRAVLALEPPVDGVLVTLADQPLVDGGGLRALLAPFHTGRRIVAAAYGGTVGVPAVIGREHLDGLLALRGDRGAGAWLRAQGPAVTTVALAAAAVDVDTPADAARLTGRPAGPPAT